MRVMKPAFALDFRNSAITLLHRASGGWHEVGSVAIDAPDLTEAVGRIDRFLANYRKRHTL